MSRGHGWRESQIITKLVHYGECDVAFLRYLTLPDRPDIYARPHMAFSPRSLRSSISRAIRKLERDGKIARYVGDGSMSCRLNGELARRAYRVAGHVMAAQIHGWPIKSGGVDGLTYPADFKPGPTFDVAMEAAASVVEQRAGKIHYFAVMPYPEQKRLQKEYAGIAEAKWLSISVIVQNLLTRKRVGDPGEFKSFWDRPTL